MCWEDVKEQRHRPRRRAGNIHELPTLYLRGVRVALEIHRLTSRWIGPGLAGELG
jgi:hypothetical protein